MFKKILPKDKLISFTALKKLSHTSQSQLLGIFNNAQRQNDT